MSDEQQEVAAGLAKWYIDEDDSEDEDAKPTLESIAKGLCGRGLVRRAVKVEHALEGCLRGAVLTMEDTVERLVSSSRGEATAQDMEENTEKEE